jgi:pilus assembly protein Flp/PilA
MAGLYIRRARGRSSDPSALIHPGHPLRRGSHEERRTIDMVDFLMRRDEEGQGLAEYALILALIAIVAIAALLFLGGQISGILSTIGAQI